MFLSYEQQVNFCKNKASISIARSFFKKQSPKVFY